LNFLINLAARRINRLRPARGVDSHSALTRFLGIPSKILGSRLPDTEFTQYGGKLRVNYLLDKNSQLILFYQRSRQDDGKRYDQLLGGDGNLIADLKNLMLDFGYFRFIKNHFSGFNSAVFTVSYNSQREERVNQGGQGNPFASITHQYERTSVSGFSFFLDKGISENGSVVFGGDYYFEKINSPAFTVNPVTNTTIISRPRIPDEARFVSGGLFLQSAFQLIPKRLRLSGAIRYSIADYKAKASDTPVVNGRRLWQDDSLRVGLLSGRIGLVWKLVEDFRLAFNYSRGFRYPSMTDLGTLGLTGDGYEVDFSVARGLGGTIGTTADSSAVSTGIPVAKLKPEFSNSFDLAFRYSNKRFGTELTFFLLDIEDTITKQALILPPGSVGRFLADQQIINQLPNGVVFVAVATNPVLVRTNYSAARIYGVETESEFWISKELKFSGNYTFIHAKDKQTGLPPNIEGGTPPPTAFLSFKYQPIGKSFWIELYSTLASKQNRLSSLDLADRRTGATRTRSQIANFFRRGACVRGLTNNPDGVCGTNDETILLLTGETLQQVQDRVLGVGVSSAPLFTYLPSYAIVNLRGGFYINDKSQINLALENIFDRPYRNPSWGIDGAGRSLRISYRVRF
jgi:hemoglobin/transferrin/lactoferrin receptor protein